MPNRIQHRRGVALPPGTKLVTRPTKWGNPYVIRPRSDGTYTLTLDGEALGVLPDRLAAHAAAQACFRR